MSLDIFYEIYGLEDTPKPAPKPLPETPVESWRWQIAPASGSADDACRKIADEAFTKAIVGDDLPKPSDPEPKPTFVAPSLAKFAAKVMTKGKRAADRGPAITRIIDECLGQYRTPMTAEAFQRLHQSCENYITNCLEAF
jgi:hypothetical protein